MKTSTRIISLILTLAMCLGLVGVPAFAADSVEPTGSSGPKFTYAGFDKTVTTIINYEGEGFGSKASYQIDVMWGAAVPYQFNIESDSEGKISGSLEGLSENLIKHAKDVNLVVRTGGDGSNGQKVARTEGGLPYPAPLVEELTFTATYGANARTATIKFPSAGDDQVVIDVQEEVELTYRAKGFATKEAAETAAEAAKAADYTFDASWKTLTNNSFTSDDAAMFYAVVAGMKGDELVAIGVAPVDLRQIEEVKHDAQGALSAKDDTDGTKYTYYAIAQKDAGTTPEEITHDSAWLKDVIGENKAITAAQMTMNDKELLAVQYDATDKTYIAYGEGTISLSLTVTAVKAAQDGNNQALSATVTAAKVGTRAAETAEIPTLTIVRTSQQAPEFPQGDYTVSFDEGRSNCSFDEKVTIALDDAYKTYSTTEPKVAQGGSSVTFSISEQLVTLPEVSVTSESAYAISGETVTLTAQATVDGQTSSNLTYQWYKQSDTQDSGGETSEVPGFVAIKDATKSTYGAKENGTYCVRVTNPATDTAKANAKTSNSVTVTFFGLQIAIKPEGDLTVNEGETRQLSAELSVGNGTKKPAPEIDLTKYQQALTWSVTNFDSNDTKNYATVSNAGLLTGVKQGKAKVNATVKVGEKTYTDTRDVEVKGTYAVTVNEYDSTRAKLQSSKLASVGTKVLITKTAPTEQTVESMKPTGAGITNNVKAAAGETVYAIMYPAEKASVWIKALKVSYGEGTEAQEVTFTDGQLSGVQYISFVMPNSDVEIAATIVGYELKVSGSPSVVEGKSIELTATVRDTVANKVESDLAKNVEWDDAESTYIALMPSQQDGKAAVIGVSAGSADRTKYNKVTLTASLEQYGLTSDYTVTVTPATYKIEFVGNDNAAIGSMNALSDTRYSTNELTANKFKKAGYYFDGWEILKPKADNNLLQAVLKTSEVVFKDKARVAEVIAAAISQGLVSSDNTITLGATWKVADKVRFNWNNASEGGTDTVETIDLRVNGDLTKQPATPSKGAIYEFKGWSTAADDSGTTFDPATEKPDKDATYYAQWKINVAELENIVPQYSVSTTVTVNGQEDTTAAKLSYVGASQDELAASNVKPGATVLLKIELTDSKAILTAISASAAGATEPLTLNKTDDGYTFVMPEANVIISAAYDRPATADAEAKVESDITVDLPTGLSTAGTKEADEAKKTKVLEDANSSKKDTADQAKKSVEKELESVSFDDTAAQEKIDALSTSISDAAAAAAAKKTEEALKKDEVKAQITAAGDDAWNAIKVTPEGTKIELALNGPEGEAKTAAEAQKKKIIDAAEAEAKAAIALAEAKAVDEAIQTIKDAIKPTVTPVVTVKYGEVRVDAADTNKVSSLSFEFEVGYTRSLKSSLDEEEIAGVLTKAGLNADDDKALIDELKKYANGVAIDEEAQELKGVTDEATNETAPVEVLVEIANPFKDSAATEAYAMHNYKDSDWEIYVAKIAEGMLSFTTKGMSPFVVTLDNPAAAAIERTPEETAYYMTVQQALDDVAANETISLMKLPEPDLKAPTHLNNGDTFNVEIAENEDLEPAVAYDLKDLKIASTTKGGYVYSVSYDSETGVATVSRRSAGGGGGGGAAPAANVVVAAATNGTVKVSNTAASAGDKVTVTMTPNSGYEADTLTLKDKNGNEITATKNSDGTYTFTMPAATLFPVTVTGTFKAVSKTGFVDVDDDEYYAAAVEWAVKHDPQITNGTDATHFSPEMSCTRAQVVTFLWRAAGAPEPTTTTSVFTDSADTSEYYYKAVLWAVENGITNGTSSTTFSPDDIVTRGQVVTFLYRYEKAASVAGSTFTDVAADAYYAPSVNWAYENGITTGTSSKMFSPDNDCTRAQIVTFLYRDMVK